MVLSAFVGGFVGGFGWFWVVPCFSNYRSPPQNKDHSS